MSKILLLALTGASALAITTHAVAQTNPTQIADSASASEPGSQEIIVTARREKENLQNVPVSVQVVSGDTLQKMDITQPAEISQLVPGLNINLFAPDDPAIILRGVRWTDATGTAAIPVYLNEIPFGPQEILTNLYDIGQIEVLRGPQGTSRGAPSISGAITIATQRPDLNHFGGFVSGQLGEHGHIDAQGAVNIPLIEGKLAVRIAADYQNSEGNQVFSLNNRQRPNDQRISGRISLRYEPNDTLKFALMFQRDTSHNYLYDQVMGTGSPGVPALGLPANYNGPAITPGQRLSVEQTGTRRDVNQNLVTFNATWDFLGQELGYNFGWEKPDGGISLTPLETGNSTPGSTTFQPVYPNPNWTYWNELRLSSQRTKGHLVDYDIGAYYTKSIGGAQFNRPATFLPGAFGEPSLPPSPFNAPLARYTVPLNFNLNIKSQDFSAYGNATIHLPFDTELSGGLRWIYDRTPFAVGISTGAANFAFHNPTGGAVPCELFGNGAITSPFYGAGTCDVPVPAQTLPSQNSGKSYRTVIYDVSLSHKFTPNILGYGTIGTSWRAGFPSVGNFGLPAQFLFAQPETATSYEVGVKTTWGRRVRFNADVFQINYKGQLTQFANTPYYNTLNGTTATTNISFLANVDARIRGVEAELSVAPVTGLTLTADASYSAIESLGGLLPCNNPSVPLTAANPMNFCPSAKGANLNTGPRLQVSVNGQYTFPVTSSYDGYFRFNVNEQGKNPNFGTSLTSTSAFATVDLFAGLTGQEETWDLGVYVKNVFDKQVVLTNSTIDTVTTSVFGSSGYNVINMNAPREFGVSARYKFK